MTLDVDIATILQGAALLLMAAIGRTIYTTSVKLVELGVLFDTHAKADALAFTEVKENVREVRDEARQAAAIAQKAVVTATACDHG